MEETVLRTVSITPLRTDPYTTGASVLPELLRPPLLAIMLNRGVLPHSLRLGEFCPTARDWPEVSQHVSFLLDSLCLSVRPIVQSLRHRPRSGASRNYCARPQHRRIFRRPRRIALKFIF